MPHIIPGSADLLVSFDASQRFPYRMFVGANDSVGQLAEYTPTTVVLAIRRCDPYGELNHIRPILDVVSARLLRSKSISSNPRTPPPSLQITGTCVGSEVRPVVVAARTSP